MQAKDKLEKFVDQNRSAFDSEMPSDKIWQSIESDLDKEVKVIGETQVLWYWKAAVVVLLAAVTFLVADRFTVKEYTLQEIESQQVSNIEKFNELESFYTSLISDKQTRLYSELDDSKATSEFLKGDIEELDDLYNDLRTTFLEQQPSEQVMERLLHLLRQKIHLINSQLEIIGESKFTEIESEGLKSL